MEYIFIWRWQDAFVETSGEWGVRAE